VSHWVHDVSRRACAAFVLLAASTWSGPSKADILVPQAAPTADIPRAAIGFSKLVIRIDGDDGIGIAKADFHVRLIERMRATGFNAVGAENLVFGKDESARAEYLIGGTVREVTCQPRRPYTTSCRIGVEWQLLDVARDEVIYSVTTRAALLDVDTFQAGAIAGRLLDAAMSSLLRRDRFRRLLVARSETPPGQAPAPFAPATLARCEATARVSEDANDLLRRVVVVTGRDGFGTGFFVSPEGLVLTAAHVLESESPKLRLREGGEVDAVPVRVAQDRDVALLRVTPPLAKQPCMTFRTDRLSPGVDVYAVGTPATLDLAFTLTRGIVSGFPIIGGRPFLQTDAPVNPGNSGGPVVDASGAVVGVITSKVTASRIEGLAFGVPIENALASLGLQVGDGTDPSLLTEKAEAAPPSPHAAAVVDAADPVPSLDPSGDRARAAAAEREERERRTMTPAYAQVMRWAGLSVSFVGFAGVLGTASSYNEGLTEPKFNTLRDWNTASWIAWGVGAVAFTASFWIHVSVPAPSSKPTAAVGLGPSGIVYASSF
jgi:S1-C subfamily serine protease